MTDKENRSKIQDAEIIEGERVYLRTATEEDTDQLVRWRNSPHVRATFLRSEPLTREIHERWRATEIASGRARQYIIIRKKDDTPIGSQYFLQIDAEKKSAEFGIYIGMETALGQGYGREAAVLAVDHAFREWKLKEIMLRVREENRRAVSMYEKLGFQICPEMTINQRIEGREISILFMRKENKDLV